jgi:hypothetical protein
MATKNKTTVPAAKQGKSEAVKAAAQKPASAKTGNKTGKAKAAKPADKNAKSADKNTKRCAVCEAEEFAKNRVRSFNLLVEGVKHVGNALGQLGFAAIDLRKSFDLYGAEKDETAKEVVCDVCNLASKVASFYEPLVRTIHNVEEEIGVDHTEFAVGVDTFKVVNIPLSAKAKVGVLLEGAGEKGVAKDGEPVVKPAAKMDFKPTAAKSAKKPAKAAPAKSAKTAAK